MSRIAELREQAHSTLRQIDRLLEAANGMDEEQGEDLDLKKGSVSEEPSDIVADQLQELAALRAEALSSIEEQGKNAVLQINIERGSALNHIEGEVKNGSGAIANALAHALATIKRAQSDNDRKRMGYGNPRNQPE